MRSNPKLICAQCGCHWLRCECFTAKLDEANERAQSKDMPHLSWFFKGFTSGDKRFLKVLRIAC